MASLRLRLNASFCTRSTGPGAPLAILDLPYRVGELPRLAMHRARRPVVAADLIEHRAADADAGVGLEARTLTRIIIARRLAQTDHAGLDQVIGLHARRQSAHQVVG